MSDRLLISGGAGFVGSSLAVAFRKDRPHTEIIALDNSTDGTEQELAELEKTFPALRHFNNPPPNGFGLAVQAGLKRFCVDDTYRDQLPDDPALTNMDNWDVIETAQGGLKDMHLFWCRKRPNAGWPPTVSVPGPRARSPLPILPVATGGTT